MKSQEFSHGYALLVGVGADLPVTVKDAQAIHDVLRNSNRCAYPEKQVQLLTEAQATRADILAGLEQLAQAAKDNSEATIIVYFSGHGGHIPDYYLVPYGYDPTDKINTAISGEEFTEKLRAIQSKKLLVLLDCCHAGGIADVKGFIKAPAPPELLDTLGQSSGRVVIASSQQDEVSYTGTPYSEFTKALLEGLSGYGVSEKDGYARVLDIAMYVGRWVPDRTQDKQHPIIKVHNLEDNFVLAYYAGGAKEPVPLPDFSSIQQSSRSRGEKEQEVLQWLCHQYESDPGKMFNSQSISKELGYNLDEMNRIVLPLLEKGFLKAEYVGKIAMLKITDLGRMLIEGQ